MNKLGGMHGAPTLNTGYISSIGGVNSAGGIGSGLGLGVGVDSTHIPNSNIDGNGLTTGLEARAEDPLGPLGRHHALAPAPALVPSTYFGSSSSSSSFVGSTFSEPFTGKKRDEEGTIFPPAAEIRFGYGSQWKK